MLDIVLYPVYFLLWTLMIYWIHRILHTWHIPIATRMHWDHHKQITQQTNKGLHWTNFFLWFDSWRSTFDQWITEVIPTILFCFITGQWWLAIAYYIWAAFIQEAVEHNPKINLYPFITSGKWHLIHHKHPKKNYGVFFPIWDIIFKTKQNLSA